MAKLGCGYGLWCPSNEEQTSKWGKSVVRIRPSDFDASFPIEGGSFRNSAALSFCEGLILVDVTSKHKQNTFNYT